MRKVLLCAACCCCALSFASCSDDKGEGEKSRAARIAFDSPALASSLNTDFDTFCSEHAAYSATVRSAASDGFRMYGYLKAGGDSILLHITAEEDIYGRVGSITAAPEDHKNDLPLWKHYITNAETLNLGRFLGTKFKTPTSSGVHQTVEDTVNLIESGGTTGVETYTLFGVIPGQAYATAILDKGVFRVMLTNSYLTLDYPVMRTWLGGDHAAFATKYYILGNKLNLWGNIYVNFSSARDRNANAFYVDVHADKEGLKITEIDIYADPEKNTAEELLAIWKDYAAHADDYGLGTFKEAYTTDTFGGKKDGFASLDEVRAHVDEKGRPGAFDGGIIVVFEADGIATNLVMNAQYIYLLMKDPAYNVE